jgi:hypothetical protein
MLLCKPMTKGPPRFAGADLYFKLTSTAFKPPASIYQDSFNAYLPLVDPVPPL